MFSFRAFASGFARAPVYYAFIFDNKYFKDLHLISLFEYKFEELFPIISLISYILIV